MFKSGMGAALALGLMAGTAIAGGFSIREQSAEAQGTSFAGAAAGTDGLSSMFWNPATLSNNNDKGLISESNSALILPNIRAKDGLGSLGGSPDSGNIGKWAVVPSSYWSYGLTDSLTLGLGFNAPLGLTTDADLWAGSPHGDKSRAETYNLNPALAYQVGDWLTLGAGVQAEYMRVNINSRLPALTALGPAGAEGFRTKGDNFGIGFTAGVLIEPTASTDIGIGFRSAIKHTLEGKGYRGNPLTGATVYSGDVSADFTAPELLSIGIQQHVSDNFRLKAGAEWANWSRFKELSVETSTGVPFAVTKQNWKDSWFVSAGGEYDYSDVLTVRAGIGYEKSPVPDATRTSRTPDNDRLWLSAGASYQLSQSLKAHLAYSFVNIKNAPISLNAEAPPGTPASLRANFKGHLNIVSVSLTRDW